MRFGSWVLGLSAVVLGIAACGDDETLGGSGGDADGDGWLEPMDCNDDNPRVYPGAEEIPYDRVDQDCSGADWTDVDQDGFDGGLESAAGAAGAGGSDAGPEDCDDTRPDVNPAAVDVCGDGIDQDCRGGDQACDSLDRDGDGVTGAQGDCDDGDPSVGPEADELYYNGIDDDCDPSTADADQDGDGFSRWEGGDCDDTDAAIFPGADEVPYDGVDQDCSGEDRRDVDGDGVFGGPEGEDCDDLDPTVGPARHEIVLDGIDQNCDGSDLAGVDEFVGWTLVDAAVDSVPALAAGQAEEGQPIALAAWADSRVALRQDVYAHLVDEAGQLVGDAIEVVSGGLEKFNVLVASDGKDFLVTWETSEGVFGRLVGRDGAAGLETQIAPAGATGSNTAFGGGNYAIVWRQADAVPTEIHVRMLSPEGVKADNMLLAVDDAASQVAVAGRAGDILAIWSNDGVQGQALNGLGELVGERFVVSSEPSLEAAGLAASDAGYLVLMRRSLAPFSVHARVLDATGEPSSEPMRLSKDSIFIDKVRAIATPQGFFAAWSDARHTVVAPAYSAIYGAELLLDETPMFRGEVALHVEYAAALGGLALVGDGLLATSRNASSVGALPLRRF